MAITREELYKEVWAEPMLQMADRHKVSASFLARICRRMRVPCPPRGYWARIRSGEVIRIPPLPEPQPGDEIEWSKGGGGKRLPAPSPSTRMPRAKVLKVDSVDPTGVHPHLEGVIDRVPAVGVRELTNVTR